LDRSFARHSFPRSVSLLHIAFYIIKQLALHAVIMLILGAIFIVHH
jgi:hypothetical protein